MAPVERIPGRGVQSSCLAIAPVKMAVVQIEQSAARSADQRARIDVADTVRPGVIAVQAQAATEAPLCSKKQSIVATGSAGIELIHKAEKLAFLRIRQVSKPS